MARGIKNKQSSLRHKDIHSQELPVDSDRGRYQDSPTEREPKAPHINERRFNIIVDSIPYFIKAVPFTFNGETRYFVSFNGSPEHVFTWDSSLRQLRAIDDDSSTMPDNLEEAISEKLQSIT